MGQHIFHTTVNLAARAVVLDTVIIQQLPQAMAFRLQMLGNRLRLQLHATRLALLHGTVLAPHMRLVVLRGIEFVGMADSEIAIILDLKVQHNVVVLSQLTLAALTDVLVMPFVMGPGQLPAASAVAEGIAVFRWDIGYLYHDPGTLIRRELIDHMFDMAMPVPVLRFVLFLTVEAIAMLMLLSHIYLL